MISNITIPDFEDTHWAGFVVPEPGQPYSSFRCLWTWQDEVGERGTVTEGFDERNAAENFVRNCDTEYSITSECDVIVYNDATKRCYKVHVTGRVVRVYSSQFVSEAVTVEIKRG